ncbi:precorrin-6A synthase (deacetylating) [Comamonas serinivorans]|uniref:Precorrin-6A synthase (Deacetylating) n=1 Tax=Comamonas serinivorans TaxID=1082851 RepID=A0A1Y0EPP2_9BURK|nr:precorrin-6A synthase (deacetylating) [Comamonas serinivorans]ARU05615.1 precorrin-6A synthase (deacetylating) [Comamonas serinivorans]
MRELLLIGIGTGNPRHLTQEAIDAIHHADVVLLPHKGRGKSELAQVRLGILQTLGIAPEKLAHFDMPLRRQTGDDYGQQVQEWHAAIARRWADTLAAHTAATPGAAAPHRVALLVWGDPALYDSTLRIAALLGLAPAQVRVVPGITAMQVLCSAHGIALNDVGAPFQVTTGRQLVEGGWPAGVDTLIVMLDGQRAYEQVTEPEADIFWGAYLGMPQQLLMSGPLQAVKPHISAERARAREQHGWIMDIYLLRRPRTTPPGDAAD